MKQSIRITLILLAVALLLPLVASTYWVTLLTQVFIFGMLALSADLILGNAGLFSLCHAAFFAVAAYTTALLSVR
jgi:branched-chain amino acid transport system permease protein